MGDVHVHEFISLDGVIDAPVWSTRTVEDDPGAPFFNDPTEYVVSATLTDPTWAVPDHARRRAAAVPTRVGAGRPALAACERSDNGVVYLAYEPKH